MKLLIPVTVASSNRHSQFVPLPLKVPSSTLTSSRKKATWPSVLRLTISLVIAALALVVGERTNTSGTAVAATTVCPFCTAVALTFSEQMADSEIVVVAKLISAPEPVTDPDADFPKGEFEIVQVLKGEKFVKEGMDFKTQLVGNYPEGQKFLVMGAEPPKVAWTTPMKASDRVFEYLNNIQDLPKSGAERLVFFQDYFEDKESVLAFDAFDEFARAPYEDLIALKDQMDRGKLVGWIMDKKTLINRRRLYFTMLGVCGTQEEIPMLEELIKSDSRKKRAGLDALIACYLNLKGEDGVDLVEKTFIADEEADYIDTLATVTALRFHGTEVEIISKKRIVKAVQQLLDRPKYADMVIPDLARWEDWSSMERLVQMFKEADPDSNWLRVPVITYLRACPKPEAAAYIEELGKIDPEAVERADFFLGFDDDEDEEDEEEEEAPAVNQQTSADKVILGSGGAAEIEGTSFASAVSVQKIPVSSHSDAMPDAPTVVTTSATETIDLPAQPGDLPDLEVQTNSQPQTFVSTETGSMSAQPTPVVAQAVPTPAATAVVAKVPNLTWPIIFVPMAISVALFLLLWSVVNGWFERLIF